MNHAAISLSGVGMKVDKKRRIRTSSLRPQCVRRALLDFSITLTEQRGVEKVLQMTAEQASRLIPSRDVVIVVLDPQDRQNFKKIHCLSGESDECCSTEIYHQICAWVVDHDQPFVSDHTAKDRRLGALADDAVALRTVIAVPLWREGVVCGVLLIGNPSPLKESSEEAVECLLHLAAIAAPHLCRPEGLYPYFNEVCSDDGLPDKYRPLGLLGKSQKFVELLGSVESAAQCDVRVLLEGPTGTGKELIARAIHQLSERSGHHFLAVDCGAIPANLFESELFGHVKGAFIGASQNRDGLFVAAEGGTLFLDEISSLPTEMQAKLMRALEDNQVRPVGSNQSRPVDVRIISASSKPLQELIAEDRLREDLYYRLMVYPIHVPALEERREDIPLLARFFLEQFAARHGKEIDALDAAVLSLLQRRPWRGNIRELRHLIEQFVAFAPEGIRTIGREHLPRRVQEEMDGFERLPGASPSRLALPELLAGYEEEVLRRTLEECEGNQSQAARALGISEGAIRYKMDKYDIK